MTAPATRCGEERHTVAFCRLGDVDFGVLAGHVVHAMPRPAAMGTLPRRSGPVDGVMDYLGQPVTVVDLRRWVPWRGTDAPASLVLVLRAAGRLTGVLIDSVQGVRTLPASRLRRVGHGDNGEEVFHTVVDCAPADGAGTTAAPGWLPLLDCEALATLCALWSPADAPGAAGPRQDVSQPVANHQPSRRASFACWRLGTQVVGVPTRHLLAMAPMQPLDTVIGGPSHVLGLLVWRGRHIPLLRPEALLGAESPGPWPLLAVLQHGDDWIAVPADEALTVLDLDRTHAQAAQTAGYGSALPIRGIVPLPSGQRMLELDPAALAQHAMRFPSAPQVDSQATSAAALNGEAYVVFRAGSTWAIPLSRLDAIHMTPADTQWLQAGPREVAARCTHRGRQVPVWDGRTPDARAGAAHRMPATVLFIQTGDDLRGLMVDELLQLVTRNSAELIRMRLPPGLPMEMLTIRRGAPSRSVQVFDAGRWFGASEGATAGSQGTWCNTSGNTALLPASRSNAPATVTVQPLR